MTLPLCQGGKTYEAPLKNFDRFAKDNFPLETGLTKDLVIGWLTRREHEKIPAFYKRVCLMRTLGKYLKSSGKTAYIVSSKFGKSIKNFDPYIFSDDELTRLFSMIDVLAAKIKTPFQNHVFPVLFRLTYTCVLRPNEGRLLLRKNINEHTGELLITKTKQHKERLIIMSDDMKSYMKEYLSIRDPFFQDDSFVFPRADGQPYTADQVQAFLIKCWRSINLNLDPDLLPHVRTYDFRYPNQNKIQTFFKKD